MSKLSTILAQIDLGALLLPEFQRGYVWNRDQVRGLMWSLYRGHPVGGLLLWQTEADDTAVRGSVQSGSGTRLLLLDGQQRITSTYASDAVSLLPVEVITISDDDPRTVQIRALAATLIDMGCAEPDLDCVIADPVTGRELAVAEAFWATGLQPGQGSPVVLELDPKTADLPRLEELGYEVFTSVDALLGFVTRRNETAAGDAPGRADIHGGSVCRGGV
jgi:hypothetical protein